MPFKFILKSGATIFFGMLIGYVGMHVVQNKSTGMTEMASLPAPRLMKLGADQVSRDYLKIRFDISSIAKKNDEISIVKISLTALKDVPEGLKFKWIIHENMSSTDQLEDTLPSMNKGSEKSYEIRVVGFSKELQSHISFVISGEINGHKIDRDVITSSRPEDSYEYVLQQQALYEQQLAQFADPKSALKLNIKNKQSAGTKRPKGHFDLDKVIK